MLADTEHLTRKSVSEFDGTKIANSVTPIWLRYTFTALMILLYAPVFAEASRDWVLWDRNGHCILIAPLSVFLIWIQRDRLRQEVHRPNGVGLVLLALGLLIEAAGYLLRIKYIGAWSIILSIAGVILLLYGREMWAIVRFAVGMLVFTVPVPASVMYPVSVWISAVSATSSVWIVKMLGNPISQMGNIIQIPGMVVEVAEICSGFNKLSVLIVFSLVYGFLYPISMWRRLILLAAAIPIAILANSLRISIILLAALSGGPHALHAMHDWAEVIVLFIAFGLYIGLGTLLGCRKTRFTL